MGKFGYGFKLLGAFWQMSKEYKAYWLVPLVVLLLLLAVLIFTGEAVVPYIYALF